MSITLEVGLGVSSLSLIAIVLSDDQTQAQLTATGLMQDFADGDDTDPFAWEVTEPTGLGVYRSIITAPPGSPTSPVRYGFAFLDGTGEAQAFGKFLSDGSKEVVAGGSSGGGDATLAKQEQILAKLSGGTIQVRDSVIDAGHIKITRGNDYKATDGCDLRWPSSGWPDLTGASVVFTARNLQTNENDINRLAATIIAPTPPAIVSVELPRAVTLELDVGDGIYRFDVEATLANGDVRTLLRGEMSVSQSLSS